MWMFLEPDFAFMFLCVHMSVIDLISRSDVTLTDFDSLADVKIFGKWNIGI